MSRIMKVVVALLAIAAIAAPAMAEDRLSLSGSMQVRGFFGNLDDGTETRSHAWNDQRLRIAGKIAVAEGVSVNFRFDASESDENSSNDVAWGGSTSTISTTGSGTAYAPYSHRRGDIQFDKAYLQVEKGGYTLMAGQQYFGGFGTGHLLDTIGTGFVVKRGTVVLAHVKQFDADNGNDSYTKTGYDETSLTAASYTFKGDGVTVQPMVSYTFAQSTDVQRLGLGLFATANLNALALKGEVDYFNGENAAGADEKGLQVYLDGSTAVSDTMTLGLIALYAQGQDGGDVQVTYQAMPVFADWHPEQYGPQTGDQVFEFDPFDPSGDGAGVMALQIYTDIKVSDDLGLSAAAMYMQTEDDDIADVDGFVLNGGFEYALAANTTLNGHLNYVNAEDNAVSGDEIEVIQAITGLVVKF